MNSGDSNKLYFGSSEVGGGGGGGSGDITAVNVSAPITGGSSGDVTVGISAATTSAAGSMSSADKTKLDGITAGATPTNTANVEAAGALMDSEVTNLVAVKAFDPDAYATQAQGVLANSAIQPGKYEAGSTPISAKGVISTSDDTSWISQSSGSRSIPSENGDGGTQVFSNSASTTVTSWNQDLVTTQGITYDATKGVWTIDTAGVYEVWGKFGLKDGDASDQNGLGNPSSSDFIQAIAQIIYESDGSAPGTFWCEAPCSCLPMGRVYSKGPDVKTVRRFDVETKSASRFSSEAIEPISKSQIQTPCWLLYRGLYQEG